MEKTILEEITPLGEHDFMYVADRHKVEYDFPLHKHDLFELNFVEHGAGVERIVGDSVELIEDYDLVLISSPYLEHMWGQGQCTSKDIHEITIQFKFDFNQETLFFTNPFRSLQQMMVRAQRGLCFPLSAIMAVYGRLTNLSQIKEGFYAVEDLFRILYELSKFPDARELSSSSFAQVKVEAESRRVRKVKEFIRQNFREEIRLNQLSEMVSMAPTAFSRFFKLRTGKTLAEYIVDFRLGVAARQLIDTNEAVSVICYQCGFNSDTVFMRRFKERYTITPTEFRKKENKTTI